MNILILDQGDFLGGAELANITITNHLTDKHQVTLIHNGSQKYSDQLSSKIHQEIIKLPKISLKNTFQIIKSIWQLRKYLRQNSYDIIHTNTTRTAIYTYLVKPKSLKWTHFSHDFQFPTKLVWILKKCHKIFTCSDLVAEDLQKKGVESGKLQTVYNGFDVKKWEELRSEASAEQHGVSSPIRGEAGRGGKVSKHPPQSPLKGGKTRCIAIVGRIDTWKGQDIFIKLAQELSQHDFWIVGKSSKHDQATIDFEQKLRRYCQKHNITNVVWKGWMKQESIWSQIDLLLHLSTKPEPMGRTIIEALLTHTPLLASKHGGAREILNTTHLKPFLIDPNNQSQIIKKIETLLNTNFDHNTFQQACNKRTQDFDIEKIAAKMLKIWQNNKAS